MTNRSLSLLLLMLDGSGNKKWHSNPGVTQASRYYRLHQLKNKPVAAPGEHSKNGKKLPDQKEDSVAGHLPINNRLLHQQLLTAC